MRISDWSSDVCSSDLDECLEVVRVEAGELPPVLEAVLVLGMADEVHGHVFDDGHVLGPVPGAQTGEVVVEDDVEQDRKSVVEGQSVSVRVDLGGRRIIKKKTNT